MHSEVCTLEEFNFKMPNFAVIIADICNIWEKYSPNVVLWLNLAGS